MKLSIKLGPNTFDFEGDLDREVLSIFRVWIAAIGGTDSGALDQITGQLESNTQRLEAAVAATTPGATPSPSKTGQ